MATEKDVLAGQEVDQELINGVPPVSWTQRALAEHRRRKDARRGNAAPGGLFDEVERKQGELF